MTLLTFPDDREQEEMLAFLSLSCFLLVRLLEDPGSWWRSLMDQDSLLSLAASPDLECQFLFLPVLLSSTRS